jgi:amino acid transporter
METNLLKRILVGPPMPLVQARHERLAKTTALAVFASDALSSTAYATEEILLVLVLAGSAVLHLAVPVAVAICALLIMVAISYQQTIHAYPSGGGSYIVARANLGPLAGLVAAASLMIDYVLTVSVSWRRAWPR